MKALSVALALSCLTVTTAKADIDPIVCGIGGAIAGGVIGHQFGSGNGKKALTVLGAIGGGAAGHTLCKPAEDSQDVQKAQEQERLLVEQNRGESYEWSNPRYGRERNSRSRIERRGTYGGQQCMMTRSVMTDGRGSYVNETYWCQQGGRWQQVSEGPMIRQIHWGASPVPPPPQQPVYVPRGIISENRMARFESDVVRKTPYQHQETLKYAHDFRASGEFITLDQLGRILRLASNDEQRTEMLRSMTFVVDQRYGSMQNAFASYRFEQNRQQAFQILTAPQQPSRFQGGGQYR